ncbi:hypothetical protein [Bacillus sp. JCM 19041]|uniref:hypothetical protein n=1 Tax=Bacillus sp. JCM 19041 TaxID=1460637 RepID=UPI000AC40766
MSEAMEEGLDLFAEEYEGHIQTGYATFSSVGTFGCAGTSTAGTLASGASQSSAG